MMRAKIKTGKLKVSVLCVVILIGVGVFLWLRGKEEGGRVLAKVGDTVLTENEFYSLIPSQLVGTLTPTQKKELLRKWIDTEVVYQAALKEGIHKESEIKSRLHQLHQEVIANEFMERYLSKIGSVDESAIRAYFDLHRAEYNSERKMAQIVVLDSIQAATIVSRLRAGENFTALALQYSIDPSAQTGGEMGYLRRGDISQFVELEEVLFSLSEVGNISDPIQIGYGYYIIKLLDIKKLTEEVKYEDVREKIRQFLDFTNRKKAFTEVIDRLREEKRVVANYSLLE